MNSAAKICERDVLIGCGKEQTCGAGELNREVTEKNGQARADDKSDLCE